MGFRQDLNNALGQNIIVRDENLEEATFVACLDTTTQTFAMANTEQVITMDTEIDSNRIGTSLSTGVFTILDAGIYKAVMFPILTKSIGTTISHFLWVQKDTGSGFVDIPDSNSETVLLATETNDIKTITFVGVFRLNAGDKIRFMNSVSNTNLTLVTKTPSAGNGPEIPSVIMSLDRMK